MDIKSIEAKLLKFRRDRDWEQFHKPKDLAISLVLEAGEVLEHFQWRNEAELQQYLKNHKADIAEELADVFNWVLLICSDLGIDIIEAANKKISKNAKKYPVISAKGTHKKYTEL